MIGACTPINLRAELARLEERWRSGHAEAPRFVYAATAAVTGAGAAAEAEAVTGAEAVTEAGAGAGAAAGAGAVTAASNASERIRALEQIAEALDRMGELGAVYAARARELAVETTICSAAGSPALWEAARRRYTRREPEDAAADDLARAWLEEPVLDVDSARGELTRSLSDDERDPGSLLSRMRAAVAARRLPFRVIVARELASLAATGSGVIHIAAARALSPGEVARTVLHEIEGHVEPRARAGRARLEIFAVGTARGSDDQEGRALSIERRAGLLEGARRRELALRHIAARSVEERADFVETVRALGRYCESLPDTLRIAARAHRGGGLARESVYLPALLRHEEAVRRDPGVDRILGAGQVSVAAAGALGPWVGELRAG